MDDWIRLSVKKNKNNKQFNFTPRKRELDDDCLDKISRSKFLKIKKESIYYE